MLNFIFICTHFSDSIDFLILVSSFEFGNKTVDASTSSWDLDEVTFCLGCIILRLVRKFMSPVSADDLLRANRDVVFSRYDFTKTLDLACRTYEIISAITLLEISLANLKVHKSAQCLRSLSPVSS